MKKNAPTIGIIGGRGKMGQWLKNFFERKKISVLIAGRTTDLKPQNLAKKADIVILSVPISKVVRVVAEISPFIKEKALLCDIASLKVIPSEAMRDLDCATLGIHPLFGPSLTTAQNQQIIFCRIKDNKYVDFLKKLFEKDGFKILEMTADEHDYQMAYIQALTHAINLLFGKIVFDRKNELSPKLHTPIFSLQSLVAGRVLQQDIDLIADIQLNNPYFVPLLQELIENSKNLLKIIEKSDKEKLIGMFSGEYKIAQNFAHYSTLQTNKILQLVSEVPTSLPDKKLQLQNLPKEGSVGYLGPEGTYSNLAASEMFGKKNFKLYPSETIFDLFMTVLNNETTLAVVPAENSTEGTVRETLDYLVEFSLYISGSLELPIHHQLLSSEKKLSDIDIVVSHPQALAQCKNWLGVHLPKVKRVSSASTTQVLQNPQKKHAYIASAVAAKRYGLYILAKNIEDNPKNSTRFYIISKKPLNLKGINSHKTLLLLTVYNRVGILRDVLTVFADNNLNLAKLESRPSHERLWDYHFFVEVENEPQSPPMRKTLKELEGYCPIIRILGQT